MTTAAPILAPLPLAEDAIRAALERIAYRWEPVSGVAWGALPAETVRRLVLWGVDPEHADGLTRAYVAQHQDGGGAGVPHLHSAGWAGLVVVKCLSASDDEARAGYDLAAAQMAALTSPAGYRLRATWDRPVAIPRADTLYTRAGQWLVTLRRTV